MRAYLLDTHVWLWLVEDQWTRATQAARELIERAADRNALAVSEVSFWEVALKAGKGSLDIIRHSRPWLRRAEMVPGIGIVQIDRDVMVASTELDLPVRDPADRMIVATALKYDLILATADRTLLDYAARNPALGVLDVTV